MQSDWLRAFWPIVSIGVFAYKLFLSLNISNFNLFFSWKLQPPTPPPPPEKSHHPLSQQPPSKSWRPVKPPLFENLVGGLTPTPTPPPLQQKGGVHTMRPKPQEQDFSQIQELSRNNVNNKHFPYRKNLVKIVTNFFKLKKLFFNFAISPIFGAKKFFQKIRLSCTTS